MDVPTLSLVIFLQCVQFGVALIGMLMRYCRYKDTGRYNTVTSRPVSFKLKLWLQYSMLLLIVIELAIYLFLGFKTHVLRVSSCVG